MIVILGWIFLIVILMTLVSSSPNKTSRDDIRELEEYHNRKDVQEMVDNINSLQRKVATLEYELKKIKEKQQ